MADRYNGPYNPKRPIPDGEAAIVIYGYVPSLALAVIALVTFGIALVAHILHFVRSKRVLAEGDAYEGDAADMGNGAAVAAASSSSSSPSKRRGRGRGTRTFEFLICFGCAMEIVGYGFRAASNKNPFVVIDFVLQYFMIVCAPVFFTAALYLSLSIAIQRRNAAGLLPLIKPRTLVIIFVIIDVITTGLQVVGAAFIGVSESDKANNKVPFITTDAANDILLAGLAVQCGCFLVFLSLLATVALRNRRLPSGGAVNGSSGALINDSANHLDPEKKATKSTSMQGPDPTLVEQDSETGMLPPSHDTSPTHRHHSPSRLPPAFLTVLGGTSLLIWLRTLFRLAETAEGVFGYASTTEGLFGGLEYAPVIIAIGIWAIFPLHRLLLRP